MATHAITGEISGLLDRLSALMQARDPAIIELFGEDDTTMLIGSEPGELARGRTAIASLFAAIFDSPNAIHWDWDVIDATGRDNVSWFYAEGSVVLVGAKETVWRAYRLSGVLTRHDGGWRFAQFHGSEPMVG